jgi:asparagine synthase (glutamine-hydrolysing)
VAHAPDLYLNERARRIAPVRMTGNYGGEVLRQVRAFKAVSPMQGLFSAQLAPHICNAHETYEGLLRSHPLSFAAFEQAPWHHYGLLALEQTQVSVRSPFLDNDLVRTAFRAPLAASRGDAISLRLIADGDATLLRIPTDRGLAGNRGTLAGALSRGWMRLSSRAEYAYGDGMPPWLARTDRILAPLRLERAFLGRHKFAHFRIWYRDALAGYVRDVLLDARSLARAYLEPRAVRRVVAEHTSGRGNHTAALHRLLTLELVHRLLIDRG